MRRAFTVLEVLVALAIFAGSAVALTSGYLSVLNQYEHARVAMQADQNLKLARVALFAQPDLNLAGQGDDFEVIEGGITQQVSWTADINYTNIADLFEVTLYCAVTPQGGTTTTTSETFRLLRPTWSDAAQRTQLQNESRQKIQELITSRQSK